MMSQGGMFHCAAIGVMRMCLDWLYGAAQPMCVALGLPPAPPDVSPDLLSARDFLRHFEVGATRRYEWLALQSPENQSPGQNSPKQGKLQGKLGNRGTCAADSEPVGWHLAGECQIALPGLSAVAPTLQIWAAPIGPPVQLSTRCLGRAPGESLNGEDRTA